MAENSLVKIVPYFWLDTSNWIVEHYTFEIIQWLEQSCFSGLISCHTKLQILRWIHLKIGKILFLLLLWIFRARAFDKLSVSRWDCCYWHFSWLEDDKSINSRDKSWNCEIVWIDIYQFTISKNIGPRFKAYYKIMVSFENFNLIKGLLSTMCDQQCPKFFVKFFF